VSVQPVSSVAAFVARYVAGGPTEQRAAATVLVALDADARLVVEAQRLPVSRRQAWLREQTGRAWGAAWLAHAEQRAFVELRRELQRRGLWVA
jgi:hypothetical protein